MKTPSRSAKYRAVSLDPTGRAGVRKQTHRVNVPRSSKWPVERTGHHKRGKA